MFNGFVATEPGPRPVPCTRQCAFWKSTAGLQLQYVACCHAFACVDKNSGVAPLMAARSIICWDGQACGPESWHLQEWRWSCPEIMITDHESGAAVFGCGAVIHSCPGVSEPVDHFARMSTDARG